MPDLHDAALPQGFRLHPRLLSPRRREALLAELASPPPGAAGQRDLLEQGWCRRLAGVLLAMPLLRDVLPADAVAVQCTLFEKSPDRNWLVALHQDLALPVAARVDHPQLTGWSVKAGRLFVLAPASLLSQMVALRLHLDDARQVDGGLRFVPGSQAGGVLDDTAARQWRDRVGEVPAEAVAGDGLLMRPLTLHASSKASAQGRRRVLHLLFGPRELPCGLRWPTSAVGRRAAFQAAACAGSSTRAAARAT